MAQRPEKPLAQCSGVTRDVLRALDIPECDCKVELVPLCVLTHGKQGCRPGCVTRHSPQGCARRSQPECVTPETPRGCTYRRRYKVCDCPARGRCDCPKAECGCPLTPGRPCRCVLAAAHGLEFADWQQVLAEQSPAYLERPLPARPMRRLSRRLIVREMARRYERGEALRHPDDVCSAEQIAGLAKKVRRGRNGYAADSTDYVPIQGQKPPEKPKPS